MSFYGFMGGVLAPTALWGRLHIEGIDLVPESGPALIVPNHDSQWDPVMVAVGLRRRRHLRFLAHAGLWKKPGLAPVMNGLRQIPVQRGKGDAAAIENAVAALTGGDVLCVFPEGKLSQGEALRARSGVARLAEAAPEAKVILAAVTGTTTFAAFPKRPRARIELFEPQPGPPDAARWLAEVRAKAPPVPVVRRLRRG